MAIQITYRNSYEDFKAAFASPDERWKRTRWIFLELGLAGLCLGAIVLRKQSPENADVPTVLALIGCAAFLAWLGWESTQHRWIKDYLDRNRGYEYSAELNDDGVVAETLVSETRLKWNAFESWFENDQNFALYSGLSVYMFPKRAFTPEQLAEFRDLLARKLPPKK